jgi:2-dehydropantoate 2-reductase
MRFLILGAGGIGAYYGARLIAAGHQVVFVARGEHLLGMQNQGLRVVHPDFEFQGEVDAISQEELVTSQSAASFDLILLTVKAGATEGLMHSLQTWLCQAETPLLSLQNGVDNEVAVEAVVGCERTIGGLAVRIGGHIVAPGYIEATGVAQVIMGAWRSAAENPSLQSRLQPWVDCFNQAAIPTLLSEQIQKELWRKLLINNGVNPLSALTRMDTRTLTSHPELTTVVYAMMEEAALAAKADGVDIDRADIDEMYRLICNFDAIKTSMLVDLEQDRPLELEAISGVTIARCREQGMSAAYTTLIQALLQARIAEAVGA